MDRKTIGISIGIAISFFLMILIFAALLITYLNAETVEPNLQGKVIILDPGHGLENTNFYEGYDEQVAMLALAHKIKPLLEARGATVHMTRPTENDVLLPARAAMINKWGLEAARDARQRELRLSTEGAVGLQNDIIEINRLLNIMQSIIDDPETNAPIYLNNPFDYTYTRVIHPDLRRVFEYEDDREVRDRFLVISLHSNATGKPINTLRNGADSFYISNDLEKNATYYANYSNEERNAYFAELIIKNIKPIGINKGKASDYYFLITRENNLPCVLVENGFHTNALDRAKLSDDAFLDKLAVVYADTILEYFVNLKFLPEARSGAYDDVFGSL